ncbi:MAG TPA: DUF839 domain-containing protein, partial [Myxococcota bacterium]|nr:DUF839 domain-containing protein [Myxococcota bacterium]
ERTGNETPNVGYTAVFPLDADHLLLWVNHEFPPEPERLRRRRGRNYTGDDLLGMMGASVIELGRSRDGGWELRPDSTRAWRLDGRGPRTRVTGPATAILGAEASGTLSNCGGGLTPWGTVLTCEENHRYHAEEGLGHPDGSIGALPSKVWDGALNIPGLRSEEVGWVVEVDPYDPTWVPRRHTALGRFRHESAVAVAVPGKPLRLYMAEDRVGGSIWRYRSRRRWFPRMRREAGSRLLEEGSLEVAKLLPGGRGRWIPVHREQPVEAVGQAGLAAKGEKWGIAAAYLERLTKIKSLGEHYTGEGALRVDAWVAGILAGGSPLGRPEGSVQIGSSIFVALTAHTGLEAGDPFAPPVDVAEGCILQLSEGEGPDFTWQLHSSAGESFANPDNLGVDPNGTLLLCTDSDILEPYGHNSLCRFTDGAWERQVIAPPEAELCGPSFATDG